jgi:hypothetical protein
MKLIEKDFLLLMSIADTIRYISREALVNVDNPTTAGKRLVRDARDNIQTMKNMIEDRLEIMTNHIKKNEKELG